MDSQQVITLQGVSKRFDDLLAVDNLDLQIHQGEILGFLGPNGAGKTTSINMICGLLPPSSGQINVYFGPENSNPRQRIGVCPQENIFWPRLTCQEQLIYMGTFYGLSKAQAELSAKGLLAVMGLMEKSGVLASKLSGGMKRRLNIALALVHDPDLLVLDEPEAGLDPQSRILVRDFVKALARKKTIILTTHNMDEADRMAERVAIIDKGKLQIVDTPEQLKRQLGEGDTLDVKLDKAVSTDLKTELSALFPSAPEIHLSEHGFTLRALDLVDRLNRISSTLQEQGYSIKQMSLRENTLEDVFISLTGRQLRQ